MMWNVQTLGSLVYVIIDYCTATSCCTSESKSDKTNELRIIYKRRMLLDPTTKNPYLNGGNLFGRDRMPSELAPLLKGKYSSPLTEWCLSSVVENGFHWCSVLLRYDETCYDLFAIWHVIHIARYSRFSSSQQLQLMFVSFVSFRGNSRRQK